MSMEWWGDRAFGRQVNPGSGRKAGCLVHLFLGALLLIGVAILLVML